MDLSLDNLDEIHQMLTSANEEAKHALQHVDLNTDILPSPEKRELLNLLMDRMSDHLVEVSHVDSFFQYCDLQNMPLTSQQQKMILSCQNLCQNLKKSARTILSWIVAIKTKLNEKGIPVLNEVMPSYHEAAEYVDKEKNQVSQAMFQKYQQWRDIFRDIHKDLMFTDPKNMVEASGKRLNVMNGNQMFIETEHEMNVMMDYSIFQYRKEGKNIAERYYQSHRILYSDEKLTALTALKDTRFSFLQIIKPIEENGLLVHDNLIGKNLLLRFFVKIV